MIINSLCHPKFEIRGKEDRVGIIRLSTRYASTVAIQWVNANNAINAEGDKEFTIKAFELLRNINS